MSWRESVQGSLKGPKGSFCGGRRHAIVGHHSNALLIVAQGNARAFSTSNRCKSAGHGLIEQRMDVMDRRYRRAFLTPEGHAFRARLLRALGG